MFDNHDPNHKEFLGFDLVDGYNVVFLLTDWVGYDIEFINKVIASNGLIKDLKTITAVKYEIISKFPDDPHVIGCHIVSIYNPDRYHETKAVY